MIPYSIKFQKMKGTFLDSIPCLKSHQPPLICIAIMFVRCMFTHRPRKGGPSAPVGPGPGRDMFF